MLPGGEGIEGDLSVQMQGSGYDHSVDGLVLKDLAVVGLCPCRRVEKACRFKIDRVGVADGSQLGMVDFQQVVNMILSP